MSLLEHLFCWAPLIGGGLAYGTERVVRLVRPSPLVKPAVRAAWSPRYPQPACLRGSAAKPRRGWR